MSIRDVTIFDGTIPVVNYYTELIESGWDKDIFINGTKLVETDSSLVLENVLAHTYTSGEESAPFNVVVTFVKLDDKWGQVSYLLSNSIPNRDQCLSTTVSAEKRILSCKLQTTKKKIEVEMRSC